MVRKIIKRTLSVMTSAAILISVALPALADRIDPSNKNGWQLAVETTDAMKITRSEAYTWIVEKLQSLSAETLEAMDSTATPNTAKILSLYGAYLVYLNWAVSNVSLGASENQWTILQGPEDFDLTTSKALLDGAETLRNRINELGITTSTLDVEAGTYNYSTITSDAFASAETLLAIDSYEIIGYDGYYSAVQKILQEYVDGQIIVALAKYFNINGTTKSVLVNALSDDFPLDWWTSTQEGSPPAEMITLISDIKEDITPYLDVYNEIMSAYNTTNYRVLASEHLQIGDQTYTVIPYTYRPDEANSLDSQCSYISRAIYMYMFSAQSGESKDEDDSTVNLDNVDLTGGVLPILANATTDAFGNVTFSGDPELTNLGYYVLAAGATYEPFTSIAGNDTYIQVISQSIKKSAQLEEVIRLLQVAINTRKPIYVTDAGRSDWADIETVTKIDSGNYRIARLSDMLSIGENTARAYAVVKGKMRTSSVDSSTFEYVRGGTASTSEDGTAVELTAESVTVGSNELLASGEEMSLPIAFTCGSNSLVFNGTTFRNSIVQTAGGLTSVILNNASLNCKGDAHLENKENEILFLNGLGDIVLSDGTVVLPAIANPILYDYSGASLTTGTALATGTAGVNYEYANALVTIDATEYNYGYYLYTASFMNSYPAMRKSADGKVYLSNSNNTGKYVLAFNPNDYRLEALRIYSSDSAGDQMKAAMTDRTRAPVIGTNSWSMSSDITNIESPFEFVQAESGNWRQIVYDRFNLFYLMYSPRATAEGVALFPLQYDNADMQESYLQLAGPIVTSAIRYISTADAGADDIRKSSGKFRIESFIEDFAVQGMLGNQYSQTMVKNYQLSYEQLVDDQYGRLTRLIEDLTSSAVDMFGRIDGALAIKNGYESGFFNIIMDFIQRAYLLIAVILFVVIAVKFLRGSYSLFFVALLGVFVFAAFQVYAVWMPTAVPAAYNMFVNDIVEDVVWNTVTVRAEDYETTYKDSGRVDAQTGEPRPYTATITLYRLSQAEIESVAIRAGVSESSIRSGDVVYLDEDAGIFIEGDAIKMSIDKLLANNTMRGLYESQWDMVATGNEEEIEPLDVQGNDNPYIVKLTSPYVSLESYYTPFCQIERAFLVNLNNFSNIFRVDRQTFRYDNYVYKDAFLFNAFTNSAIFTSPNDAENDYANLRLNIREDTISGTNLSTAEDIIAACEAHMQPFDDWLNLRSVFYNPSDAMKESLWGKMLQRQGYYGDDWSMTQEQSEKVSELIRYIDDQTKQFVIRNTKQLNFCSDENAIKLVSLYATTCFTHRVSSPGFWLYPNYINASDIELRDVLYGAMTTLEDRYQATDGDIVNTVTLKLGAWGALLVLFITLVSAVFIFIMTYLVPVLYALFGVVLVYKLMNTEQGIGTVKGYLKVTVVTILLYIAYSFGLKLVGMFGYAWYGYLGCLIVTILCIYFLFYVCLAVVTNPLELGNDVLARTLFGALDKLTGHRLSNLTTNVLHIKSNGMYGAVTPAFGLRGYARGASIDDRANVRRPRRGEHYGRWQDFDDDNLSYRSRIINRFGNLQYVGEVGRTRTGFRQSRPFRLIRNARDRIGSMTWTASDGSGIRDRIENFVRRR